MTLRVYLALMGLTIKYEHGAHVIELELDGATVQQVVKTAGGEWYVEVNAQRPKIHKDLRSRVTAVTSQEGLYLSVAPPTLLPQGCYRSHSGKANAEVRHAHFGDPSMVRVSISITARSIPALLAMRRRLLFGETKVIAA